MSYHNNRTVTKTRSNPYFSSPMVPATVNSSLNSHWLSCLSQMPLQSDWSHVTSSGQWNMGGSDVMPAVSKPGAVGPCGVLCFLFIGFRENRCEWQCGISSRWKTRPRVITWRKELERGAEIPWQCYKMNKMKTRGWEALPSGDWCFVCDKGDVSILTFSPKIWNNCTANGNVNSNGML